MKKGFTLIELLVVLTIFGIFFILVYTTVSRFNNSEIEWLSSPEEKMASEMRRSNDLKEKELEMLRARLQAEKNP